MLEVLLVRVEEVHPNEESSLRDLGISQKRDGCIGGPAIRMIEVDVRTRGRFSLEGRLLEAFESVDPAELGRKKEVRCGPGRSKPGLLQSLGEKNVLAQVLHLVPVVSRHL